MAEGMNSTDGESSLFSDVNPHDSVTIRFSKSAWDCCHNISILNKSRKVYHLFLATQIKGCESAFYETS